MRSMFLWLLAGVFSWTGATQCVPAAAPGRKPNIVFILADDLGYGDVGAFGQEKIRTPNLDRLAEQGMRLTRHYSGSAVCAPSRCVLMTGKHPGHALIRDNREVKPEGQHPLPAGTVTLANLLQAEGYRTGGFGKWGLGGPGSSGDPLRQGFHRFYGYHCQRLAHNHYPTYLWNDDRREVLSNPEFASHQKFPGEADPRDPGNYRRYAGVEYAPDRITEAALEFVRENRGGPFFLYYPTTVPHLALQVPEDSLQDYAGAFPEEPYLGNQSYLPHPTPRAAYAAMVTRMDRDIGRIIELIRQLGLEADTIFIFSSDNGPLYNQLGGTDTDFFQSAQDLRGRKGSLYEGGVRVPAIVTWKGRIEPGSASDRISGFEDWLPTLRELIGARENVPAGVDGISLAPTLLGRRQEPRPFLYREFPGYGGQQAIWAGDWKAVRQGLMASGRDAAPRVRTQLYRLSSDPGESRDVSEQNPEVVSLLSDLMNAQHAPSETFKIPALDAGP